MTLHVFVPKSDTLSTFLYIHRGLHLAEGVSGEFTVILTELTVGSL